MLLTAYITLGNSMDCMLVSHRNSYIEALITHVMLFGDVALGLDKNGGTLEMRLVPIQKETGN